MIDGEEFLKLAELWIQGATEAEWRCAVSRAYYGAFHVARRFMRRLGFVTPRADQAHAYLWLRLSNCGEIQVQSAGSELNRLRRERNRADYDLERAFPNTDGLIAVQTARQVVQILHTASAGPTLGQLTDAMKAYERDVLKTVTWQP